MTAIGIDVAKQTLAVDAVLPDGKRRQKHCANSAAGHAELVRWIGRGTRSRPSRLASKRRAAIRTRSRSRCMTPATPSVCSIRSRVAAYGQSQLRRAKTDPTDAALIADYVRTQTPPVWTPPSPEARQLQAFVRRLDALLDMHTQELNRLELAAPDRAAVDHGDPRAPRHADRRA